MILLLLTAALPSEAQYKLLLRGQPSPFDTAVAVEIHRYREEGLKLQYGQKLVDSLNLELYSTRVELRFADRIHFIDSTKISALEKSNTRKDSVNQVVAANVEKMIAIATKKEPLWKDPKVWVVVLLIFEITFHLAQ